MIAVMAGPIQHQASTHTTADSRFAPSQWGMVLLCNNVSHWLGTNLESAQITIDDRDF